MLIWGSRSIYGKMTYQSNRLKNVTLSICMLDIIK